MASDNSFRHYPTPIGDVEDKYIQHIVKLTKNDAFQAISESHEHSYSQTGPVDSVDFLLKENSKLHHTSFFQNVKNHMKTPIFRRGQPFSLIVNFRKPFQLKEKNLKLVFKTGHPEKRSEESLVQLYVTENPNFQPGKNWSVRMINKSDQSLKLEIKSPSNCPVGIWKLNVITEPKQATFHVSKHMYILFNPWCKDDAVFLENDKQKDEYVLTQWGVLHFGNHTSVGTMGWNYNQFFPVTLPAAICVLEASIKSLGKLESSSPIDVCRALTYAGCYYVLWGDWSGKYEDGTAPQKWTGSQPILEQFMKKLNNVKFAQCWVFGAVTCSLCRALGIPCRVVTTFASGHDTNRDLVIDDGKTKDQLWNYHVWNEAWMTRPDLPPGYGGWQAFDSTPQEFTESHKPKLIYECGPASVDAIKKGEIGHPYDALFIYSEVNAEYRNWQLSYYNQLKCVDFSKTRLGKLILTKVVGTTNSKDIKDNYKFPEGSDEERQSLYNAARLSGIRLPDEPKRKVEDIFFDLLPLESVEIGQPIRIIVKVENRGNEYHVVKFNLGADSIVYSGVLLHTLDISRETGTPPQYKRTFTLAPGQNEILMTEITEEMYFDYLSTSVHFRIHASAIVYDTHQTWYAQSSFLILKPKLQIEMPNEIKVGQPFTLKLSFTNPLSRELSNCVFNIEANCNSKGIQSQFRNIQPMEIVVHAVQITPEHRGPCSIVAHFHSNHLKEVLGLKQANCS